MGAGAGSAASGLGSAAGDGIARHAPSDYADKVKARVLANKVFPMEAQLKGQECVITYSVTVDRAGHMIAHHIDPCPYPLVNAAAEAAILKSGPYEPAGERRRHKNRLWQPAVPSRNPAAAVHPSR
ncbi:MAG: energy transducer TonB [Aliidongia sp.]